MSATITMPPTIPQGFKALPLPTSQLSLSAVLKCGQSFRWHSFPLKPSSLDDVDACEWRLCLKDRVVCLRQSEDFLFYRSVFPGRASGVEFTSSTAAGEGDGELEDPEREKETLAFIRDYFQLDTDLIELYDTWSASDPVFRNLRTRFKGIRMLRQDPWECLISFICSSNNNISRISKMLQTLCTHFSPPLLSLPDPSTDTYPTTPPPIPPSSSPPPPKTTTYHPFPPPSSLSGLRISQKLRALGFGYRADYIQKSASRLLSEHGNSDQVVFEFLEGLRGEGTERAREALMVLMGVGRKVADCVLLMSLDKREVIPVDTHVHQIALKHYGLRCSGGLTRKMGKTTMSPKLYDEVNARLTDIWGEYAGWAHSVLFTADLKSFSTYGLPTPSPTPTPDPSTPSTPSQSLSLSTSRSLSASPPKPKPTPKAPKAGSKTSLRTQTSLARTAKVEIWVPPKTPLDPPARIREKRKRVDFSSETKIKTEAETEAETCTSSTTNKVNLSASAPDNTDTTFTAGTSSKSVHVGTTKNVLTTQGEQPPSLPNDGGSFTDRVKRRRRSTIVNVR